MRELRGIDVPFVIDDLFDSLDEWLGKGICRWFESRPYQVVAFARVNRNMGWTCNHLLTGDGVLTVVDPAMAEAT